MNTVTETPDPEEHDAGQPGNLAVAVSRSQRSRTIFVVLRTGVVGLVAGLVAVGFKISLEAAEALRASLLAWAAQWSTIFGWAVLPLLCGAIGCIVGLMTYRLSPEAAGSGIPHLKGVLLHARRLDWRRVLPVKFIGGVLGIGAGLSLGREGPTVQMGAAAAQLLARLMRTPAVEVPQLLTAGAGAGLAAAFNAPLAGLVFVIEELHRELSARTATGALVSCVTATVVAHTLSGDVPSFQVYGLHPLPLSLLPVAILIGAVGGLLAVTSNKSLLLTQKLSFRTGQFPRWILPGIVCAVIGLIAWWVPVAAGGGHALAASILSGSYAPGVLILLGLFALKFILTCASYGSGAPGGIFAPMLLLGALAGSAFAYAGAAVIPGIAEHLPAMAVLGMAAFFVGSVRAPLTGVVLISEMTGGYTLLFPICVAALSATLAAAASRGHPIYEALLEADLKRNGGARPLSEPQQVYIGIQTGSAIAGKTLGSSCLPRGCLVTTVERGGRQLHPAAELELLPGDHITVLYPGEKPESPMEIVRLCTGI